MSRWSAIANHLPGRTDNEIKNFWNTHLKKKLIQMGFDPMTHRPRTDIFSSLPHLIALANLKDLVDNNNNSCWEEQQSIRLQTEVAKLQYLQYLLQPPNNYPMPNLDMDTLNLLNSLPSAFSTKDYGDLDSPNPFDGIRDHLPGLKTLETPANNFVISDNQVQDQVCEYTVLSHGENSSTSPWLPSSPSPPPPPVTTIATATATSAQQLVDCCTTPTTTCTSGFWPDHLLLDDSLFNDIP